MAATVISIAQQKGGAGKTTLAAQLAVAWARGGKSVALLDIDPQQSLTMWHGLRAAALGAEATGLTFTEVTGWRTARQVDQLKGDHDIVVIDCPPHAETEAKLAIRAADLVVVPVQPSPMDLWATRPTLELARQEKVPALIVFNRVPARANLTEAILARVRQDFDVKAAKARIGNRVAFAASMNQGLGAPETVPRSRAAQEIGALGRELLRLAAR